MMMVGCKPRLASHHHHKQLLINSIMHVVPPLHVEYCTKSHHAFSTPEYRPLYPPNNFERAFSVPDPSKASELIGRVKASIDAIDDAYGELQKTLGELEEHRQRLEFYLARQKTYSLPSPIRRLPSELLLLVFSHASQSFEHDEYLTPLSISLTCFKWRSIALSTPTLWTNIFVGSVGTYPNGAAIFPLYIERSRSLPISLRWETKRDDWFNEYGVVTGALNSWELEQAHQALTARVWDTCESWERVEMSLDKHDMMELCKYLGQPSRLQLRHLEHVRMFTVYDEATCPDFTSAHKLRTVDFPESSLPRWTHSRFLFTGIDTLTVNIWGRDMAPDLPGCGFVEGNRKTLVLVGNIKSSSVSSLIQCYVTRLIIRPSSLTQPLVILLSSLCLPGLEEFTLDSGVSEARASGHKGNVLVAINRLLKNSVCALRVLKITFNFEVMNAYDREPRGVWPYILSILEQVPTLQSLFILEGARRLLPLLTAPLISAITLQKLVPNLTTLGLVWSNTNSLPVKELVELLESRARLADNLARLSTAVLGVRQGGDIPQRVRDTMQMLRKCGVQASLW